MLTCVTQAKLEAVLASRGGVVVRGKHADPTGPCCILEAVTLACERPMSDVVAELPDLRPLNDGPWSSDAARTAAMVPLAVAFADWGEDAARRQRFTDALVVRLVQVTIAQLPQLPKAIKAQCEAVTTKGEATAAAAAATKAATAATAAWAAAAAAAAAWAATAAKTDRVLLDACAYWRELWLASKEAHHG
jgi:hypothetical protein